MIAVPSSEPRMTSAVSRGRRTALRNASRRRTGLRTSTNEERQRQQRDEDHRRVSAVRVGADDAASRTVDDDRATQLVAHDPTVAHLDRAVRAAADALVVRDDDQREPVGVQLAQELHDLIGGLRVERARGLVGPHDARPTGERAGDGDALLLAARQLGRAVLQAARRARRVRASPTRAGAPLSRRHPRATAAARRSRPR